MLSKNSVDGAETSAQTDENVAAVTPTSALKRLLEHKASGDAELAKSYAIESLGRFKDAISADEALRTSWREACATSKQGVKLMKAPEFDALAPKAVPRPRAGAETAPVQSFELDRKSITVESDDDPRDDWTGWRLVQPPARGAYVAHISNAVKEKDFKESKVTQPVAAPFLTSDKSKMIMFPLEEHEFTIGTGAEFITAVGLRKPKGFKSLASLPAISPVNAVSKSRAREYVVHRKVKPDPITGELVERNFAIVGNKVSVENVGSSHSIGSDRKLISTDSLGMTVINHRDDATIRAHVTYQDSHKTAGQASWYSSTMLGVDVQKVNLPAVAEFLRTVAKASKTVYFVEGLGPVEHGDRWVFITGAGAFDMDTGQTLDTYAVSTDRAEIRQFGITYGATKKDLAVGYENMARILDTCPPRPGIPAVLVGAAATSGLSATNHDFRVLVYLHGRPGSGKTGLSKLILAMQSPSARGYSSVKPTVAMRQAKRGGTTNNGANMSLQFVGGFLPLVDDFVQLNSTPQGVQDRQGDLNVMVQDLASTKQNWTKNGPAFARGYVRQGSILINAERAVSMGSEGILRRIIEAEMPDVSWSEPGGCDAALMLELDSKEVMDRVHQAWSDLLTWQMCNPIECEEILYSAREETSGWDEVPNAEMRNSFASVIAGLHIVKRRAQIVGVDLSARVDLAIKDLRETAGRQYALIGAAKADFRSTVLTYIRELLFEGKATVVGEPPQGAAAPWVDPFVDNTIGDDEDDPDEAPRAFYDIPLDLTRRHIGMRFINNAWTLGGPIFGYLKLPKTKGRKPATGACGYVWLDPDHVNSLRKRLMEADLIDVCDTKSFRAKLIAESVAVSGRDGGPNGAALRSLRFSAEEIWPVDSEGETV